jgi:hypothetical protein
MAQAAIDEGLALDPRPFTQDGLAVAEVDVGRGEVAQALVSPSVVVVLDKGGNPRLQFAGQVGVWTCYGLMALRHFVWLPRAFSVRVRMTELGDGAAARGSWLPGTLHRGRA